jgi:hypothetical protein
MQHLLRDRGRISGTLTCANVQDACYARFAPPENTATGQPWQSCNPWHWEDLERELRAAGASPLENRGGGAPAAHPVTRVPARLDSQAAGPGPEADRRRHGRERRPGVPDEHGEATSFRGHRPLRRGPRRPPGPRGPFPRPDRQPARQGTATRRITTALPSHSRTPPICTGGG